MSCASPTAVLSPAEDVAAELVNGSATSIAACVARLNRTDVAVVAHHYGVYGGTHGDEVLAILQGLQVPSVTVAYDVLDHPKPHQRWVMERIAATSDRVVVMSESARDRLCGDYGIERRKVVTIPHGGTIPDQSAPEAAEQADHPDLGPARTR